MFSDDGYNNNYQNDFETSSMTTSAMDPSAFSSDILSGMSGPAQYDYNKGFNDIALLAEFIPMTMQAPEIETEDSVEEFIAASEKNDHSDNSDSVMLAESSDDSVEVAVVDDGE